MLGRSANSDRFLPSVLVDFDSVDDAAVKPETFVVAG